jgi:organic radical activating enzyme
MINAAFIQHFGSFQGNLVRAVAGFEVEYPPGTEDAGKHTTAWPQFDKQCVFLLDSPRYNRYVGWVLEHYATHMAGARVEFRDNTRDSPHRQEIVACGEVLTSERHDGRSLFGDYKDYLLVMRLPGLVSSRPESAENRRCPDTDKTIWVVAGIHSKASQAGAVLFEPKNLPFFAEKLMEKCGGEIPEYFEAVYEIPSEKKQPLRNHADLEFRRAPKHFRILRLKTRHEANWAEIPLETVHLDPVAACNYSCPECIESRLKQQKTYLSLTMCLKVLCDLKAVGCHRVNLYGGEPTLHPAFPELLRTMSAMGFETLIVTNGSQLPRSDIRRALIDCRKNVQIRVSLDACSQETHSEGHGTKKHDYDNIVSSTRSLIREGLHTTISILLHPNVVKHPDFANVRKEWEDAGAQALVLRPVTGGEGKDPNLRGYTKSSIRKMIDVLAKGRAQGFVQTPDWFEEWLRKSIVRKSAKAPKEPKQYQTCYSAYYRMVVSPAEDAKRGKNRKLLGVDVAEVSDARLSWCSYRRNPLDGEEDKFGMKYPENLSEWLRNRRLACLGKIDPHEDCKDIYCCRHGVNKELYGLLG